MSELGLKLIAETKRVAAENPDYIYKRDHRDGGCHYVVDGKPSCLLGHALWNLGVIGADFTKRFDSDGNNALDDLGIEFLLEELRLELDFEEINYLGQVQGRQDSGRPWGKAVS